MVKSTLKKKLKKFLLNSRASIGQKGKTVIYFEKKMFNSHVYHRAIKCFHNGLGIFIWRSGLAWNWTLVHGNSEVLILLQIRNFEDSVFSIGIH